MSEFNLSKWIESDGGPLILMEKHVSVLWEGHSYTDTTSNVTDYDRACEIEDYLGLLDVGHSKALVMNDEPLSTACWKIDSETIVFVRWVWAKDERVVPGILSQVPEVDRWENTGIEIGFAHEELILFDSAYRADEVEDFLLIQLPKGEYTVKTLLFEPDANASLILHCLKRNQVS